MRRLVLALLVLGGPAAAEGLTMTDTQRAAFGALVRAALLDDPTPIARAFAPPDPYAAEKAADLALIAAHGAALFGGWPATRVVAFFDGPDCADCARAVAELHQVASSAGWRVTRHAVDSDLGRALGVPDAPFYMTPDLMLRGWIPAPVLTRYMK